MGATPRTRPTLTRRGTLLVLEGFLLYGLARAIAVDELYALALAAVTFPLLAMVFVAFRRPRVVFSRSIGPRRVFAGGAVRLTYGVRNFSGRSSTPVLLDDPMPRALGGSIRVALPALPGDRHGSVGVERVAPRRGRFVVGPLLARVEDPFGLAVLTAQAGPASSLVVYPHIEVLHEASPRDPRTGGAQSRLFRLASQGEEFYAIRDWEHGDDLRKIHWRSSAKRGALQIRQDEVRPFPHATVVVDTRVEGEALEWAVTAAASSIWEFARLGFGLRMATPEVAPAAPRWGREAADPLLRVLATVRPSEAAGLVPAARRVAKRPGASGLLLAIIAATDGPSVAALARARAGYDWAGAVLLDVASFDGVEGRERAEEDQRMAQAERTLARAGWRVLAAGATDRFPRIWQSLTEGGASRPSSPSLHL